MPSIRQQLYDYIFSIMIGNEERRTLAKSLHSRMGGINLHIEESVLILNKIDEKRPLEVFWSSSLLKVGPDLGQVSPGCVLMRFDYLQYEEMESLWTLF